MATDKPLTTGPDPVALSDDALLARLAEILAETRRTEADLIAYMAEVDARRLYLREACGSMFAYCVERLHLSEPETALRIVVARAVRRHPVLLDMLRDGRLHLSGVALLAPHLREENRDLVLARASHRSKRQIEELVASLAPHPDVPCVVRRLPDRHAAQSTLAPGSSPGRAAVSSFMAEHRADTADGGDRPDNGDRVDRTDIRDDREHRPDDVASAPALSDARPHAVGSPERRPPARGEVTALAPGRYKVQFTASADLKAKLDRLQQLMRRSRRDDDIATLIEVAVDEKIARLEARQFAATPSPRRCLSLSDTTPGPRYIPAAVKRAVRQRDGDRCAYVDSRGRRCNSTQRLEFHHRLPHAWKGDRSPANIALFCRGHNAFEAGQDFGPWKSDPVSRRSGT